MSENSVSILFVGDGSPVPLHNSLFTVSPHPFGRFSRLLREAKRLPYALTNFQFQNRREAAPYLISHILYLPSYSPRPSGPPPSQVRGARAASPPELPYFYEKGVANPDQRWYNTKVSCMKYGKRGARPSLFLEFFAGDAESPPPRRKEHP